MDSIIQALFNDIGIKALVDNRIYPFGEGSYINSCIVYEFSNIYNSGIRAIDTLNITAIAFDITTALQILDRVKTILLTIGDNKFNDKILSVEQNGGGSLSNNLGDKTAYHFKANFNITRRV